MDDFNEALRAFLIAMLPIHANEIEISFDLPSREWSSRLTRPTLNVFLHDVRENSKLRGKQPAIRVHTNGYSGRLSYQPLCLDLHYIITAWTRETNDQYRILTNTLAAIFRHPEMPTDILQNHGLEAQAEEGVTLKVAQYDMHVNPRDLWSVLDNELHMSVDLMATITLNPFAEAERPLVSEIQSSVHQILASEERVDAP